MCGDPHDNGTSVEDDSLSSTLTLYLLVLCSLSQFPVESGIYCKLGYRVQRMSKKRARVDDGQSFASDAGEIAPLWRNLHVTPRLVESSWLQAPRLLGVSGTG